MSENIVEIKNLKFTYKQSQPLLEIAELKIPRSQKIFIYGPSGSGKTTLLSLMSGVLRAQSGSLKVLDQDLCLLSSSARDRFRGENCAYIFQLFNLVPYLNVLENILLPSLLNKQKKEQSFLKSRARELATHLGIEALLHDPVTELSVGQQQRVAACRALLTSPPLLIADEPTSALDTHHRERFLKLIFEECEQQGTTLLFVSHDDSLRKLFDKSYSMLEINQVALKQSGAVLL